MDDMLIDAFVLDGFSFWSHLVGFPREFEQYKSACAKKIVPLHWCTEDFASVFVPPGSRIPTNPVKLGTLPAAILGWQRCHPPCLGSPAEVVAYEGE